MNDDLTDAPVEGSAFLRHFSYPFEKLENSEPVYVHTVVDPFIGWFKTSACNSNFPWLNTKNAVEPNLNDHDATVFKMISNYEDLLSCRRYPDNETARIMYCAHALNHALRSRKLIVKNNEREQRHGVSDDLRDQGFHRARILILAPTKESARRIVHTFLSLMPKGSTVSHRRRFERDFGPSPGEASQDKRKGYKPKDYQEWFSCNTSDHFRIGISFAKKSVKLYSAFADSDLILASPLGLQTIIDEEKEKEADLQYITASTELLIIDQAEMLLMQNWSNVQKIVSLLNQRPTKAAFASAARIRLAYLAGYGRRYRQTLIFSAVSASLITLLTGDCENFQGLNFIPPLPHFDNIYPSYLPDSVRVPGAKRLQTHQMSLPDDAKRPRSGADIPTLTADFKLNLITFAVSGQALSEVQMGNESDSQSSEDESDVAGLTEPVVSSGISSTGDQLTLSVQRIPNLCRTYMGGRAVPLARMNAFKLRVLPRLRRGTDPRVLIYVPDFYDLEELRVLLTAESLDFCCVNEYSEDSEAERFRTLFALGRIRIMLLSERYYFFRRRKIRGAQTFIFYGPPTFPWFVRELIEFSYNEDSVENQNTSTPIQLTMIYYPPYEAHQVSTITGKVDL